MVRNPNTRDCSISLSTVYLQCVAVFHKKFVEVLLIEKKYIRHSLFLGDVTKNVKHVLTPTHDEYYTLVI